MKTYTTIAALMLIHVSLSAQDKGFVSGTIGFSSEKTDPEGKRSDETTNTFRFGPAVGINLSAQHVVGLALDFNTTKTTSLVEVMDVSGNPVLVEQRSKESLFEIAPFYRYMKSAGDKFLLYGQLKAGIGFGKQTTEADRSPDQPETKLSTFRVGIGPGIVFVPATRWALSADWGLIGYSSRKEKVEFNNSDSETTTSRFDATLNPGAITLALNWLF
jgi:hypothetical protein